MLLCMYYVVYLSIDTLESGKVSFTYFSGKGHRARFCKVLLRSYILSGFEELILIKIN